MTRHPSFRAILGLGIIAFIWGYNWVVIKEALQFAGPFTFASLRALSGGAILFAMVFILRRSPSPGSFWGILLLALLQTTGFFGLSVWALVSGGAGKIAVLVYTMPLWMLILAWPLLGERIRGLQWLSVFLEFIGLVLILRPWSLRPQFLSMVLAVSAGFIWALAGIWNKRLRQRVKIDLLAVSAWQLLLGGIPLLIIAMWQESTPIQWTPYFIFAIAYNAVLGTAIAWTLWFFALQELPAGIAGMGILFAPVVGVLAAWLQLGEVPGIDEGFGMICIFTALAVLSWWRIRKRNDIEL